MSTTAGLGTTEYVAINPLAVATVFLGVASALALLDNTLLAVPVLAVLCGIFALRQIYNSGGTQTGRGLAVLGLLLAIVFSGIVLARAIVQHVRTRADTEQIDQIVKQVSKDISEGKSDAAYAAFSKRFTARVSLEEFSGRWDALKKVGKLKALESNGRLRFYSDPDTGQSMATGMVITEFDSATGNDRLDVLYVKSPGGGWTIDNIPQFFPDQSQSQRGAAK
jgi:hypothetical protein